jgi:hypothetical protein
MDFFNSPNGKTRPDAELAATLKSFFTPIENVADGKEHPQCNFPARFKWLNRQLSFDPERLPFQKCNRLKRWIGVLDPVGVTLVFASYFMNNPASMFGHTLLRIDSKRTGPSKKLLNYGANYAAKPDTENAVLYALKGLVGLFEGHFTIFPYYTKVQEYNNWESRDLWEYELNFTEDQLDYLLLHLWELGGTFFEYYYFQENCSYHILSLLEVANPELHLKDEFFFSVIPADTIKIITEQEGLLKQAVYRPAVLNQMNQKRMQMTGEEGEIFHKIVEDPAPINQLAFQGREKDSQALILDAYLDYLQYKSMQRAGDVTKLQIPRSVLLARSRLHDTKKEYETTQFSTRPDKGHGSDRFRFGVGHNDDEPFQEFAYRPAYHDLLAKETGYSKDSEIIFLDIKARYYYESDRFTIDQAKILGLTSLTAYDPILTKPSWRLGFGMDTIRDVDCNYCNSLKANFGIGMSYRPEFFSPLQLYGFIDLETEYASELEDDYRVGGSLELGSYVNLSEDWKIQLAGAYNNFSLGDDKDFFTLTFDQRYSLSQNLDIRIEYRRHDSNNEAVMSANFYF